MKKILVFGMILILLSFLIPLNLNKVEAYTGEIDPESIITMPSFIHYENGVGTGTVSLASTASGYTISYQKVDLTATQMDNIRAKSAEATSYINENTEILQEKEANVNALYDAYIELTEAEMPDSEAIQEAENKYNEAYADYEEFYDTVSANLKKLQDELRALIPGYTSSWTETTNSTDNVKLDFSNYSGEVHFVLWIKIENGTNTYYDMETYTSEITDETVNAPSDDSETPNDDSTETPTPVEGDWTDFSNAKFELKRSGSNQATVKISGVEASSDSYYYLFINNNANKPNVTSDDSDLRISLQYDSENKALIPTDNIKVTKEVELNQDLYASILEVKYTGSEENIVVYGQKLERFEEPKYADAFFATFVSDEYTQIVTNFTYSKLNDRKLQIKIGKITDTDILQKIKNKDASGFADLLTYAKSEKAIYDEIVNVNKNDSSSIEYIKDSTTENEIIDLKNLEDSAYYFLYIQADDEDGKYITQEAVTLAQASVNSKDSWGLFFYGSSDFEWADFETSAPGEDDTTAPGTIPQTGAQVIIWSMITVALIGGGIFAYIKYRKNNYLK